MFFTRKVFGSESFSHQTNPHLVSLFSLVTVMVRTFALVAVSVTIIGFAVSVTGCTVSFMACERYFKS